MRLGPHLWPLSVAASAVSINTLKPFFFGRNVHDDILLLKIVQSFFLYWLLQFFKRESSGDSFFSLVFSLCGKRFLCPQKFSLPSGRIFFPPFICFLIKSKTILCNTKLNRIGKKNQLSAFGSIF